MVETVPIELNKTSSAENIADGLTKPLPGHRIAQMREHFGVLKKDVTAKMTIE